MENDGVKEFNIISVQLLLTELSSLGMDAVKYHRK